MVNQIGDAIPVSVWDFNPFIRCHGILMEPVLILGLRILHHPSYIMVYLASFHWWVAESEEAVFGSGGKGGRVKTSAELAAEREFLAHFLHR